MPYLTETIAEHERRCLERMDAIIEHDDFAPMSGEELGKFSKEVLVYVYIKVVCALTIRLISLNMNTGSASPLSASMVAFYTVMLQFVNNICLIGSLTVKAFASYGSEAQLDANVRSQSHCILYDYPLKTFTALQQDCG